MPPKSTQKTALIKERTEPICQYHYAYLGELCKLWPITRDLWKCDQTGSFAEMQALKAQREPIIKKAREYLLTTVVIRDAYSIEYEQDPEFRKREDEWCKNDVVHWINYWCWTEDPRMANIGMPTQFPLVMWPKQEEFILFVDECYRNGWDWLAEKSRAWGLTWLLAAFCTHLWIYQDGFVAGFGSRVKELVDRWGDPSTIFSKIRFIIYNLPNPMRPEPFRKHTPFKPNPTFDNLYRIVNPEKGSAIIGEGGDNIGRGGRTSIYIVDEKAHVEHQVSVDRALSETTTCQGDISTVAGYNEFAEKRFSGKVKVFTAFWFHDPAKNPQWRESTLSGNAPKNNVWHEYQLERLDETTVAQEIDINYQASVEGAFIPPAWVQAAVGFDLEPTGDRASGYDVAGGGENKAAYCFRIGPVMTHIERMQFATPTEANMWALDLAIQDKTQIFTYDQDGIGESVWGEFDMVDRKINFIVVGVHGNSAASEKYLDDENLRASEKFANRRAENWWNARQRFKNTYEHVNGIREHDPDEMISIPNDTDLTTQLSQPLMVRRGIKFAVEDKKAMRTRGVKSPDLADACVNMLAELDESARTLESFDSREQSEIYVDFDADPDTNPGESIVSIVLAPDMSYHVIFAYWHPTIPMLQVYDELVSRSQTINELAIEMKEASWHVRKPVREWIGSANMFAGDNRTHGGFTPDTLFRREKIPLKRNYRDDQATSLIMMNMMFKNRLAQVHTSCNKLMHQISNITSRRGKVTIDPSRFGLALALLQLVLRLRMRQELKKEHLDPLFLVKNPYKNSMGHFARHVKRVDPLPSYYKHPEANAYGQ